MMIDQHLVELRGEIPRDLIDVVDAVVAATPGASRMSVVRGVLAEWVDRKVHESMLIQRVRRHNGTAPESDRNRNGKGPE